MRPNKGFGLAAVMLLAGSASGVCQAPTVPPGSLLYRHRLLGVFDTRTGEPIADAQVLDVANRVSAQTTTTGTVTLAFLPDGASLIRIQKIGYQPATLMVEISPSDTVPLTLLLSPSLPTLPAVITRDTAPQYISPGLRAFEERRHGGLGHFIPESELRKHDTMRMTNLVGAFPGLSIVCPKTGLRKGECYATSVRHPSRLVFSGGDCPVDVYLDGVASIDNNLQGMSVIEYAGVEYYSGGSTIPPQYNRTGSSCGVLLFWTRER